MGSGEFFHIPCDLVISAVGEQVDDALMAANGIELDKKGRPAFRTNVAGVYAAGDAKRGPATVVEGIADAAAFAEAVIGEAHTYDIPEQAYVTKADAEAKKGILAMSALRLLRGRALPAVRHRLRELRGLLPQPRQCGHPHGRRQPPDRPRGQDVQRVRQLHPVLPLQPPSPATTSSPCSRRPRTWRTATMPVSCSWAATRSASAPSASRRTTTSSGKNDLPADLEKLIVTIRDKYGYLYN